MDSGTLSLELCAPEKPHVQLDVAEVTVPGAAGVFAVFPGHTPLLSNLLPGVLIAVDTSGEEHYFAVHGGFVEVKKDRVVVLANHYEIRDDIEIERAVEAEERAAKRLQRPPEDLDWQRAEFALSRALARQHASRKSGHN